MRANRVATFIAGGALTVALSTAACATSNARKPYSNPFCERTRTHTVDEALGYLSSIDDIVPQTPPEEAAYLEKEYAASLKVNDLRRISVVISRPYFHAWQLRDAIESARLYLEKDKALPSSASPKEHIQAIADADSKLANVRAYWDDYQRSALANNLPNDVVGSASADAVMLTGEVGNYVWCWADKLPPQPQ